MDTGILFNVNILMWRRSTHTLIPANVYPLVAAAVLFMVFGPGAKNKRGLTTQKMVKWQVIAYGVGLRARKRWKE